MKNLFLLLILFMLSSQSCTKPKPFTSPTTTIPVPQLVMDFFVNYDIGTCWVYQDSINPANFDTIELTRILPSSHNNGKDTLLDEFGLFFQPHKTNAFWVWIGPLQNNSNSYSIQIEPVTTTSAGELEVFEQNGTWDGGVYRDSMRIMNKTYSQTLEIRQSTIYFADFIYAKNIGLISYIDLGNARVPGSGGNFKFVKTFKK